MTAWWELDFGQFQRRRRVDPCLPNTLHNFNFACISLYLGLTDCFCVFLAVDPSIIDAIKSMSGGKRPASSVASGEKAVKFQKAEGSSRVTPSGRGSESPAGVESGQV